MIYLKHLYSYCNDHRNILWFSVLLGTTFVLLHAFFCIDMYDDVAKCYLPMARDIGRSQFYRAFTDYQGLAPLLQTLAGGLCYIGCAPYSAVIIISGLFYILTIFPLYLLLKRFTGNTNAAWGSFAYIIAPKMIRFGCTGILNSGRNLFIIWAIYLLLSFFDKFKLSKLVLLGISLAGLALIRGEGVGFLPLFGLMFIILFFLKQKAAFSIKHILRLAGYGLIVGIVTLTIISPRLLQMYRDTGYPVIDARQKGYISFIFDKPAKVENKVAPTILDNAAADQQAISSPPSNLESNAGDDVQTTIEQKDGSQSISPPLKDKQLSRPRKFIKDFTRGSYELYLIFAIIGLVIVIYRRKWNYEYYFLFAIMLLNIVIFYKISLAYRYFTLNILLFMPFTLVGVDAVRSLILKKRFAKLDPTIIFAVIVGIILLAQIHNGMSKLIKVKKFYFIKPTGEWLKERTPIDRKLILLGPQPQYAAWADAERCSLDLREVSSLSQIDNYKFDYIVIGNKRKWLIEALHKRGYQTVKHPHENKVTIFNPRISQSNTNLKK